MKLTLIVLCLQLLSFSKALMNSKIKPSFCTRLVFSANGFDVQVF